MRVVASEVARVAGGAAMWVTLRDADGREGVGEACPLHGRSIDDVDACARAIDAARADLGEVDADAPVTRSIPRALAGAAAELDAAPAARFAMETALLDLVARSRRVSIAELLGGARPYHAVALNAVLRIDEEAAGPRALPVDDGATGGDDRAAREGATEARVVAEARALHARGIRALKVKVRGGVNLERFARDVGVLAALRAALPDVELRVDLNGGLALADVRSRLAMLAPVGVRYVEQPVSAEVLFELGDAPVPWAADETLALHGAAERLAQRGAAAAFVVKPAFVGGLLRARAIAELGLSRGIAAVVTHALDGPVSLAAACELALSLSRPPSACGLAPHASLARFPQACVRHLRTPGLVRPADAPGLGVVFGGASRGAT